jgi:hypothetical protein
MNIALSQPSVIDALNSINDAVSKARALIAAIPEDDQASGFWEMNNRLKFCYLDTIYDRLTQIEEGMTIIHLARKQAKEELA